MSKKVRNPKFEQLSRIVLLASTTAMVFVLYILAPQGALEPISLKVEKNEGIETVASKEDALPLPQKLTQAKVKVKTRAFEDESVSSLAQAKNVIEVPRVFPSAFPDNMVTIRNISTRKDTFVQNLLPLILKHNEEVLAHRKKLKELKKVKESGGSLNAHQRRWLTEIALTYKLRGVSIPELLKRVDIIPPSLALGQAVIETGWGKAKAVHKNSPFGMMASSTSNKVKKYETLQDSVSGYIHNLNTNNAYAKMRSIRSSLRNAGEPLCSLKLVEGLGRYSELGMSYTHTVKNAIKTNDLKKFDRAQLVGPVAS